MAEGRELPKYLGKFEYDDLEGYSKAISAVANAVTDLSVTMGGAFPDTFKEEPLIEDLIERMDVLAEENVTLFAKLTALIEKARERSNG